MAGRINFAILFIGLLLMRFSYAQDFNQLIPEGSEMSDEWAKSDEDEDPDFMFSTNSSQIEKWEDEEKDSFVVEMEDNGKGYKKALSADEKYNSAIQPVAGTFEGVNKLKVKTKSQQVKKYDSLSKKSFGFSYIKDEFTYKDQENVFEQTFRRRNSSNLNSDPSGIVRIHNTQYFHRGWLRTGWGAAVGVGYNGGKGVFRNKTGDEQVSSADIKLWTIPLDLYFNVGLDLTSFFKVNIQLGGSALGLIQNRSDLENGKAKKRQRQVGYGYSATGFFKINLSRILPSLGFEMLSLNSISRYYLHVLVRQHSYSNFKSKDIEISGTSYGVGLSFDYL